MRKINLNLLAFLFIIFLMISGRFLTAQPQSGQILLKSSGDKPFWVNSNVQPVSESGNYFYVTGTGIDADLKEARKKAKTNILEALQKDEIRVIISDTSIIEMKEITENDSSRFTENYQSKSRILSDEAGTAYCLREIENYWEHTADRTGERFTYHILQQYTTTKSISCDYVQKQGYSFSEIGFRAIVPGWGQLYKTKYYSKQTKAWILMGGAGVSVAGLITSNVMYNKNYDDALKYRGIDDDAYQTYKANAQDWENIGNVFIGLTAAIWIYNLIDVYAVKGEKRYAQAPVKFVPEIANNQYLLTCNIKLK